MPFDKDGQVRQGWLRGTKKENEELQGATNTWVKGTLQCEFIKNNFMPFNKGLDN